jgi:hypothetical protein
MSEVAIWYSAAGREDDKDDSAALREILLECGLGSERLCCRDAVLSRPSCLSALALALGRRVRPVKHPSPVVRAWLTDLGPYAFFGRAADELLCAILGRETLFQRADLTIRVTPRIQSQPHKTPGGTLAVLLLGDVEIDRADGAGGRHRVQRSGARLGRLPVPSSRGPLVVQGRLRAPSMHATGKRNQIIAIATEKFSRGPRKRRSVRVVTLASDPRGVAPVPRRPGTVPMELIVEESKNNSSAEAAALEVPYIKVLLPIDKVAAASAVVVAATPEADDDALPSEPEEPEPEEPEPSPDNDNVEAAAAMDENLEHEANIKDKSRKAKAFSFASCLSTLAAEAGFSDEDLLAWGCAAARAETVVHAPDFPTMLEWAMLENLTSGTANDEEKPALGNALPWVRAISDERTSQACSAMRYLVRMAVHGLEVFWGRRPADDPQGSQDFEGTAHALITESIVGLRIAVVRTANLLTSKPPRPFEVSNNCQAEDARPVSHVGDSSVQCEQDLADALAKNPTTCVLQEGRYEVSIQRNERVRWEGGKAILAAQTLTDSCLETLEGALLSHLEQVWKNCNTAERRDVDTMRIRSRTVAKDVSKDMAFSTVLNRHISSHDVASRPHQPRDDGFVDGRDTTDTNPGQRAFMTLGAVLSRRAPWPELCEIAKEVAEELGLLPEDPTETTLSRQKRLMVNGVALFTLGANRSLDETELACRGALRAAATHGGSRLLHEVSVELSHSGVNLNGLPDRLLRPVQLRPCPDANPSWQQLLDMGVVKWLGQDEQMGWHVASDAPSADTDFEEAEDCRRAWEPETELRCGYHVVKVPQRQNGHPSRLHYFIKLAAKAAASAPLVPGKGRRFVGISNLSEGSVLADPHMLGGIDDNQEGIAMAVSWGCAGGSNHEDSLAVPERAFRFAKLHKEIELVRWTSDEPLSCTRAEHAVDTTAIGDDGLPRGNVLAGQPLAVFRKVKDAIGHSRKRSHGVLVHEAWNSPVDGTVVAARRFPNRIEVVVRQPLPADEGVKLGFVFQKMTQTVLRRPLLGTWLDVSAVSHPTSMLSRQSPALLLLGLRNLEAAGRCLSPRLHHSEEGAKLRTSQRDGASVFWDMVECPDVPHHASGLVHDDATGRLVGKSLVVILRASQAAAHHPYAGVSGRCDDDGDGKGPRQEPLLRMLLSSLGYDAATEEQSPAAIWSGCGHRLCTLAVCSECMTTTCECEQRRETFLRVPEQLALADGLARQQHLQIKYTEGQPVPAIGPEPRPHEGAPATSQQLHRAAMHAAGPKRAPPGPSVLSFNDVEEESVVTLSGRGARVVGMALLDKLQESGDVAVEDVEERGRSEPFEYIFRTPPRLVAHVDNHRGGRASTE